MLRSSSRHSRGRSQLPAHIRDPGDAKSGNSRTRLSDTASFFGERADPEETWPDCPNTLGSMALKWGVDPHFLLTKNGAKTVTQGL